MQRREKQRDGLFLAACGKVSYIMNETEEDTMKNIIDEKMIAPCGLNCSICSRSFHWRRRKTICAKYL